MRSPGYWTMEVVGADVEGDELVPLCGELYPIWRTDSRARTGRYGKLSMPSVPARGGGAYGPWTGERPEAHYQRVFLARLQRFVISMRGDRHVAHEGVTTSMRQIAERYVCPHVRTTEVEQDGVRQKKTLTLGCIPVYLPEHSEPLTLVVVKGYAAEPVMLLINLDVVRTGVDRILEIYLARWKCVESYRFMKQGNNLEDLRVLTYTSFRNMMTLVQAVFYFVSVELGKILKFNILLKKVCEKAKRFYEIPDFKQYAIADGIYRLLFGQKTGVREEQPKSTDQMLFAFVLLE